MRDDIFVSNAEVVGGVEGGYQIGVGLRRVFDFEDEMGDLVC